MPDPWDTPVMRQYAAFKKRHPDCVLFFRMGDFYEMFGDDAETVHRTLGLTLTRRQSDIPMAGVPHHQLDTYLAKAIAGGLRVAVCDQVQDPADAKGPVARAVTRVVTPGTVTEPTLLSDEQTATLAAACFTGDDPADPVGLATVELSTGVFTVRDLAAAALPDELARASARELLYADTADGALPPRVQSVADRLGVHLTPRPAWHFRRDEALEALREHYRVATLSGFGIDDDAPCARAAGVVLRYLTETQTAGEPTHRGPGVEVPRSTLAHLRPPRLPDPSGELVIDATSLRSLEIERTIRSGTLEGSLLGLFLAGRSNPGRCRTPMGKRQLAEWLRRPLADRARIEARQAGVAALVEDRRQAKTLAEALAGVSDTSRIRSRIALGRASPRDVVSLGQSLCRLEPILDATAQTPALADHHARLQSSRATLDPLAERIAATCADDVPARLTDGGVIRDGVDPELDEARALSCDAGQWLADYQTRLVAEHDLPSLKVGYNKVFGYYIELPGAQARRAPDDFTRKQTLKNAERYITPELKQFEHKVLNADARALERERVVFGALLDAAAALLEPVAAFSDAVAELDAALAFADKAHDRNWCRPEITDEPALTIHAGRHPVLDELLEHDFVPNDLELGTAGSPDADSGIPTPSLALITGPNMAGKSTFIRQVALITILAHAGGFVPADRATIGLTDRVFTRVGADDALHRGQSTFMVEMTETAGILNAATPRSLIILDEIGRGTSTLDGLSLAWAIAEHLGGAGGNPGPRTLFATHYHELTDLEDLRPGKVKNLHVSVREWNDEIVFLHRILPGRTDRSYGIHVARLAGVPRAVTERADAILAELAVEHAHTRREPAPPDAGQLGLFTEYVPHPVISELREIKLEALTPLEAFDRLRRLRDSLDAEKPG